jgi:hypothetical protein
MVMNVAAERVSLCHCTAAALLTRRLAQPAADLVDGLAALPPVVLARRRLLRAEEVDGVRLEPRVQLVLCEGMSEAAAAAV